MKKLVSILFIVLGMMSIQSITLHAQGVAVVDLDVVATELGVMQHIAVTVENLKFEEQEKLKDAQQTFQVQAKKAIETVGEKPDKETQQQAQITLRELQTQFQKAQAEAGQRIQVEQVKLIHKFREELKPIALKVAKKRNLKVVLNRVMPPVYVFDESVDITKEVIEEAKKAKMTKTAPARKNQ